MRQDERAPFDLALQGARPAAYAPGEFVGQESFMRAGEILALARSAGIGPGVSVLDLCCGVGGPGVLIIRELGCAYLGVDCSASAVAIARERATGLDCRFEVARVPPVPRGRYDVVLLLETMLAFPDKAALIREVSTALSPGGRFAFTLEEGRPLTEAERAAMPDGDTVWLTPLPDILRLLESCGLRLRWLDDCSQAHRAMADALYDAFAGDARTIVAHLGYAAFHDLLLAHLRWSGWLGEGRVRKFALVAEKVGAGASRPMAVP